MTAKNATARAERVRLNSQLLAAMSDLRALNRTRGPLGHGVVFHADRDSKAAALNARIAEIRAALASLELPAAAPVNDADFDLEAMFPVPPTTSRRSLDARVAHTTNKRGW